MATFENTVNTRTNPITGKTEPHTDNRSDFEKAVAEGDAWIASIIVTPSGGTSFYYIENLSPRTLHVRGLRLRSASQDDVTIYQGSLPVDNSDSSPTVVTPVNLRSGGGTAASKIKVESDPDLTVGTSDGSIMDSFMLTVADTDYPWGREILLETGAMIFLRAASGTGQMDGAVELWLE